MLGLESIQTYFSKYTVDTFPHSLIIVGKEGSGKRSLCKYLAESLNINLLDITAELSEELINNIYRTSSIQMYLVDARELTEKKQNVLLKLFEEPYKNAIVIIIANSRFQLLNTVLNRGILIEMPNYSSEVLAKIAEMNNISIDKQYIKLFDTPGSILKVYSNNINIESINELVDKIVFQMSKATFPNMLTILNKINFKDEYDKIDLDIMLKLLYNRYVNTFISTRDEKYFKLGNLVNEEIKRLSYDSRLNKKLLTESLLITIWKEMR